jgi:hypothetical protein
MNDSEISSILLVKALIEKNRSKIDETDYQTIDFRLGEVCTFLHSGDEDVESNSTEFDAELHLAEVEEYEEYLIEQKLIEHLDWENICARETERDNR